MKIQASIRQADQVGRILSAYIRRTGRRFERGMLEAMDRSAGLVENTAKTTDLFTDRTGNLRQSIQRGRRKD